MTRRLALVFLAAWLAAALIPAAALAQGGGSSPFGPLPPPPPKPTPVPEPIRSPDDEDVSRETLFLIGLGVAVVFVALGMYITRDARRSLSQDDRAEIDRARRGGASKREAMRDQRTRSKQRARQKGKAQRAARRKTRGR